MEMITQLSQLTKTALDEFKKVKTIEPGELAKAGITQSTGLVYYDLQAPAKQVFPVLTPLRNSIPRKTGGAGTATNWKTVTAINTLNLRGFVPEGKRNGVVTTTVVDKTASYKALGLEDTVSFEAELAAVNFEDVRATTGQRLLWATMIEEELADLGANLSVTLGTPTAPTVTKSDTGGSIAADDYDVRVVALTLHGYLASTVSGGVVQAVSVTNPVGGTFSYNGGSSQKSTAGTVTTTAVGVSKIQASTPVVRGAVAYAWYAGPTGGDVVLQAITTINSVELTALETTTQNVTAITADASINTLGYDGLLYHAWGSGSNSYVYNMANGDAGEGTPLTADGAGGINEINVMFKHFWDEYRLSPTKIYVSAQETDNITKKVLSATPATMQYPVGGTIAGGLRVKSLMNRYAMNGSVDVPLELHPNMPAGTMMAVTEQLPYPVTNIPAVWEKKLRRDYYQIEWPQRERQYESGVYMDGVLAHYFTPSLGIITNIGNG